MARYDVYPGSRSLGFLLDCQSDLLDDIVTSVVFPLMPAAGFDPVPRLNPVITVNEETLVTATQLIFAIPRERLQRQVDKLAEEQFPTVSARVVLIQIGRRGG